MAKAKVSEIDRLMELASDEKPHQAVVTQMPHQDNNSLSLKDRHSSTDQKDPKPSMWRLLLELRVLLPYLSRVLPVLEKSVLGTNVLSGAAPVQHRLDTTRFDAGISDLEDAHKNLTAQLKNQGVELKNQTLEIKTLQEQLGWLTKSMDLYALRQEEIVASLAGVRRMVLGWGLAGVILVVAVLAVELLKAKA